MQRKTKNIIAAVTLTGLLALTAATMYLSKSNTKGASGQLEAPHNNSSDTNNAQFSIPTMQCHQMAILQACPMAQSKVICLELSTPRYYQQVIM